MAIPKADLFRLMTVGEYLALGEVEHGYTELQEGRLQLNPNPGPDHNRAVLQLADQLDAQLPSDLALVHSIDIDLELAPPDQPGTSRRPDLVVVDRAALPRVEAEGGIIRASEVRIVVEVVSPGSRRTDHVIKRTDYADAGIPHYWVLGLAEPGTFTATAPFPVTIDLDRLN